MQLKKKTVYCVLERQRNYKGILQNHREASEGKRRIKEAKKETKEETGKFSS